MLIIQLMIALVPLWVVNLFIGKYEKKSFKRVCYLFFYVVIAMIVLTIYDSFIKQILNEILRYFSYFK